MKRWLIFIAVLLLPICAIAEKAPVTTNELNLVDEWYMCSYLERQCAVTRQTEDGYTWGGSRVDVAINDDAVILSFDDEEEFVGRCCLNTDSATILVSEDDIPYVLLSIKTEPEPDVLQKWRTYSMTPEETVLFTPTRMITGDAGLEYVFNGSSLFIADETEYEKGEVIILSDDAFLWKIELDKTESSYEYTGDLYALFLRTNVR